MKIVDERSLNVISTFYFLQRQCFQQYTSTITTTTTTMKFMQVCLPHQRHAISHLAWNYIKGNRSTIPNINSSIYTSTSTSITDRLNHNNKSIDPHDTNCHVKQEPIAIVYKLLISNLRQINAYWISFNIDVASPECLVPEIEYEYKYYAMMSLPLLCICFIVLAWFYEVLRKACCLQYRKWSRINSHGSMIIGK